MSRIVLRIIRTIVLLLALPVLLLAVVAGMLHAAMNSVLDAVYEYTEWMDEKI